ncbi:MAG: hypothetical protein Q9169_008266, partial [Polycauliona sp. 2 TL-2023]
PFPIEYHEIFDLINVRFVTVVIKDADMDQVVRNILQMLRGYLQWQEVDAFDFWTHPQTTVATSWVKYIAAERSRRGLPPRIAGPLLKSILSIPLTMLDGQQNIVGWTEDLMRLQHFETPATLNHPSPIVLAGKQNAAKSIVILSLQATMIGKSTKLETSRGTDLETEGLKEDLEDMKSTLRTIVNDEAGRWNFDLTWIVARKAIVQDTSMDWMTLR